MNFSSELIVLIQSLMEEKTKAELTQKNIQFEYPVDIKWIALIQFSGVSTIGFKDRNE